MICVQRSKKHKEKLSELKLSLQNDDDLEPDDVEGLTESSYEPEPSSCPTNAADSKTPSRHGNHSQTKEMDSMSQEAEIEFGAEDEAACQSQSTPLSTSSEEDEDATLSRWAATQCGTNDPTRPEPFSSGYDSDKSSDFADCREFLRNQEERIDRNEAESRFPVGNTKADIDTSTAEEIDLDTRLPQCSLDAPDEEQSTLHQRQQPKRRRRPKSSTKQASQLSSGLDKANSRKGKEKIKREDEAVSTLKCQVCDEDFKSRNQLFKHIKKTGHAARK